MTEERVEKALTAEQLVEKNNKKLSRFVYTVATITAAIVVGLVVLFGILGIQAQNHELSAQNKGREDTQAILKQVYAVTGPQAQAKSAASIQNIEAQVDNCVVAYVERTSETVHSLPLTTPVPSYCPPLPSVPAP